MAEAEADKSEPPKGAKIGPWALSTIVLIAVALIAFGLSEDKMRKIRDANIEINLLMRGPRHDFQTYCRAAVESVLPDFTRKTRESFLSYAKTHNLRISLDDTMIVRPVMECPFPQVTQSVREALALVLGPHPPNAILVSPDFLNDLNLEIERVEDLSKPVPPAAVSDDESAVLPVLQRMALASKQEQDHKIVELSVYAYQSDAEKEPGTLSNCAFHNYYFKPITTFDPITYEAFNDLRIQVQLDGQWCLRVKPADRRYLQSIVPSSMTFLRGYFASRIRKEPSYSRPDATDTAPRNWLMDQDPTSDDAKDWGNSLNELGGFDFPALSARMFDLGDLTVENAARKLSGEYEEYDASWEIFGVKLPGRMFIAVCVAGLVICLGVLVWSIRRAGRAALSDLLQDMPPRFLGFVLCLAVSVAPAVGLLYAAERMRYAVSSWLMLVEAGAATWLLLSFLVILRWCLPKLSEKRPVARIEEPS
ncbi:hypothetical protein [Rhizobium leguminosarum]|uniref:hypothetical protein n=1 Tax=Rhizobium leguminosarum TaxID=384 RepID=UPI001C950854|nr:hypothetical protein [Rhizobium leguminosarum]MBY5377255.1 hypothetical protein [Rhizobium leguminosarum]